MFDNAVKKLISKNNLILYEILTIGTITLFLYIFIFALCGYYPFGNDTLITWDLEGQYLPFMSWFSTLYQNNLSSPVYTQSIPLGGGTIGLWAYYLSSPFNLILLFCDIDTLPAAVTVIILAKHAFSAMAMYFYFTVRYPLDDTNRKKGKYKAKLFWGVLSVIYAFSGYAINMQFNVMWLDGMIVLPMVGIALEWLVKNNKSHFLVFSLSFALVTNFYIGYMLWIFSFFYFLFLRLEKGTKKSGFFHWKLYLKSICISAGLCAIFILPLIYSLSISKLSGSSILGKVIDILNEHGKIFGAAAVFFLLIILLCFVYGRKFLSGLHNINNKIKNILGRKAYQVIRMFLFIALTGGLAEGLILLSRKGIIERSLFYLPLKLVMGAFNSQEIVKGMPNIYVPSIVVLLGVFFAFDLHIDMREKMLHCGLAGIIFISMAVKKLNYIWHGFSAPNGSNYRYSFILSFVLIMIASYYIYYHLCDSEIGGDKKSSPLSGLERKQKIIYAVGMAFLSVWFLLSLYKYQYLENDFLNRAEIVVTVLFYLAALICYMNRLVLLIFVTCLELILNAIWCLGTMSYVKWDEYQQEVNEITNIVAYIKNLDKSVYRIEIPDIGPNGAFMYGYDSISHYSSVMPAKAAAFLGKFGLVPEYMGNLETMYAINLDSDIAGLLNIKYIVSKKSIDQDGYVRIASLHGYDIYENSDFQPRGILAHYDMIYSDNGAACMEEWTQEVLPVELNIKNNQIMCQVTNEAAENKILAFSIAYDKGWKVLIDGKLTDTGMLCDELLCVQIPEGEHKIILEYHVPYLKEGACISGFTVLLCGGLVCMAYKKKKRRDYFKKLPLS